MEFILLKYQREIFTINKSKSSFHKSINGIKNTEDKRQRKHNQQETSQKIINTRTHTHISLLLFVSFYCTFNMFFFCPCFTSFSFFGALASRRLFIICNYRYIPFHAINIWLSDLLFIINSQFYLFFFSYYHKYLSD